MKLVIVGPGYMPIPPTGWGAVESLIWDYKVFLDKYHPDITTVIVNVRDHNQIVQNVNAEHPDVVHIQYDDYAYLSQHFRCKKVLITSHYAYLTQKAMRPHDYYFRNVFPMFVNNTATILALSKEIMDTYRGAGVSPDRLFLQHNGANDEIFRYTDAPKYTDRSIYLAKIDYRKRQYVYQDIPNLFFAGNHTEARFRTSNPRYLGEWSKPVLYENLTDYANLVLLSDGEAHPLVVCEALVSGLGVVISECAAANLDTSMPFIDVVPNDKLNDIDYVSGIIAKNREVSVTMRARIREYGLANFSWKVCVDKYATYLRSLIVPDTPITMVTAFYDIGRAGIDGRTINNYKGWLLNTLRVVKEPFVVYIDNRLGWNDEIITARLSVGPVKVIETDISEVCMWKYKERIHSVLNNPIFRGSQKHPHDITNVLDGYCMIQYSKFGFLEETIRQNPFNSRYFSWIDAGLSRFIDISKIHTFDPSRCSGDYFYIQGSQPLSRLNDITCDNYIGTNTCILHGGLWVMQASSFRRVRDEVMRIFEEEMLAKDRIDNEQIAIGLTYKNMPDQFKILVSHHSRWGPVSIFEDLFVPIV